eukprot:CAMPEP_0185707648 /NCGR_PEP_ID=MMETSP1164-20130828/24818_1 /TAXON_ID=1104430 /ORGANISM="Chrysoreinhardia sp, Strain CCMP2950" /LENGTH=221 /DNA_ID=CAMNT_0028375079 /DNA_START=25 /DNA_END=687 /DNA_ORIENTATION=+
MTNTNHTHAHTRLRRRQRTTQKRPRARRRLFDDDDGDSKRTSPSSGFAVLKEGRRTRVGRTNTSSVAPSVAMLTPRRRQHEVLVEPTARRVREEGGRFGDVDVGTAEAPVRDAVDGALAQAVRDVGAGVVPEADRAALVPRRHVADEAVVGVVDVVDVGVGGQDAAARSSGGRTAVVGEREFVGERELVVVVVREAGARRRVGRVDEVFGRVGARRGERAL